MTSPEQDDHSRTIIHIDIDCFYAQVEMNKNPKLRSVPLGIRQKDLLVTSNYKARELGVTKGMCLAEAKEVCPQLVLVNGEDLYDYRQVSYELTALLKKYTPLVERLGLDENFLDVTALVGERLGSPAVVGHLYSDSSDRCDCGCEERLTVGSMIAAEVRERIKVELNLTTCAGIAHNKLLAKLVGKQHRPDQQTVIFPNSALELIMNLKSPVEIPGIGRTMSDQLEKLGVKTIEDLQSVDLKRLGSLLGEEKAKMAHNYCYSIDTSPVKPSGKPQTIGLEDSCKTAFPDKEVRQKLEQLLSRLLLLMDEDGRIPKTIKLTVRKFDTMSHRESRQCNLNTSHFTSKQPNREAKIMTTIMHLFSRVVDLKKPYHITLLGLAFTKFQEPPKNSIVSFLKKDVEVQSITSIKNEKELDENSRDKDAPSTSSVTTSEVESPTPSPKKLKLTNLVSKKRCFEDFTEDCESPSKLKVAELCLDSIACPPDADKDVFKELPIDVQRELWEDYKRRRAEISFCSKQVKKAKPNTLLNYFIKNN